MFVTISLLLAAACLLPAAGKLTGQPRMRKSAVHFGISWPRYRLIGAAELAAATGILTGLWWHPSARGSPGNPLLMVLLEASTRENAGGTVMTESPAANCRRDGGDSYSGQCRSSVAAATLVAYGQPRCRSSSSPWGRCQSRRSSTARSIASEREDDPSFW
jgi:DoxX-like family